MRALLRVDRLLAHAAALCLLTIVPIVVGAQAPAVVPAAPSAPPDREIQIASDAFAKDPVLPRWVQPSAVPASTTAGAAVVVLADSQVLVGDRTTTYAHRAIKVNDATALSSIGRVPLAFIPAYQRLVLHALQVVRDGAVLDRLAAAQVRFLQRETGLENNVYSGVVTASILIDDLRVGDTLEIAYSTIGTNPVFGPVFSGAEGWDQPLPIDVRRVILNVPVQRRVAWKAHGELAPAIAAASEKVVDGVRVTTFEGKAIAALPPETSVPSGVSIGRYLEFSEYADWNTVATWASSLFVDTEPPSAERAAVVATLMSRPTTEERVVAALEFVQSQVRYFSVSLGTSSHRPALPNTVLTRRYGDCKDKSLLLVTLLKDMGIASTPALARLGNRTGFDDRLPTPLVFDHVIVEVDVDGAPYFLDATRMGQYGRLARMGQVHDDSQVLLASPSTRALLRIAVPNREELAREDRNESLSLAQLDGDGELKVVLVQNGVLAEVLRGIRGALTQERTDALMTADMEKRYPGAKLIEPIRVDDDRQENRLTLTARFTLPKPAKRAGNTWVVPFRPDNLVQIFVVPPDSKRRGPVSVRFPINAHYAFDATFPDEVSAVSDGPSTTIDDPVFRASAESSSRGNHSVARAEIRTVADRIAVADLPRLRDDLEKFRRGFPGGVVVRDADLKKSVFLGLGRKDLAATMRSRQEDVVTRTSATIKSGRLGGADLASAYCTRGTAELTLERGTEATQDGDQAVGIDPNAPDMLICRAGIRLGMRSFAAAIDDLSRAVVMGAESGQVYFLRGQAKFHLGRYADAAADFATASAIDKAARSAQYSDLWRAMSLRRLGQPLPDDLVQHAAADPRGEWPRPAFALLADRLAPEEVGPLAARGESDAATLNGTEADFYLGEFYLSRGDAARARDAFTASRAHGAIVYTEHIASGIELDKLARP